MGNANSKLSKDQLEELASVVQQKGVKASVVCADVSNEQEVEGMFAKTIADLGSLDIVSEGLRSVLLRHLPMSSL